MQIHKDKYILAKKRAQFTHTIISSKNLRGVLLGVSLFYLQFSYINFVLDEIDEADDDACDRDCGRCRRCGRCAKQTLHSAQQESSEHLVAGRDGAQLVQAPARAHRQRYRNHRHRWRWHQWRQQEAECTTHSVGRHKRRVDRIEPRHYSAADHCSRCTSATSTITAVAVAVVAFIATPAAAAAATFH